MYKRQVLDLPAIRSEGLKPSPTASTGNPAEPALYTCKNRVTPLWQYSRSHRIPLAYQHGTEWFVGHKSFKVVLGIGSLQEFPHHSGKVVRRGVRHQYYHYAGTYRILWAEFRPDEDYVIVPSPSNREGKRMANKLVRARQLLQKVTSEAEGSLGPPVQRRPFEGPSRVAHTEVQAEQGQDDGAVAERAQPAREVKHRRKGLFSARQWEVMRHVQTEIGMQAPSFVVPWVKRAKERIRSRRNRSMCLIPEGQPQGSRRPLASVEGVEGREGKRRKAADAAEAAAHCWRPQECGHRPSRLTPATRRGRGQCGRRPSKEV